MELEKKNKGEMTVFCAITTAFTQPIYYKIEAKVSMLTAYLPCLGEV